MTDPTLGSLTLGVVKAITYVRIKREANIDLPLEVGSQKQILGREPLQLVLSLGLYGSTRYDTIAALERAQDANASLKFDSDFLKTTAFIKSIKRLDEINQTMYYELTIGEGHMKQINSCDATTDFSVDSGGGSLTADSTYFKEGTKSLKLSGTIAGATASTILYTPSEGLDLLNYNWVRFWFRISSVANMTTSLINLYYDASNYVSYDFKALHAAVDTWYLIRVLKSDFTETGTMNWDEVQYLTVSHTKSAQTLYDFYVDDLSVIE